MRSIYIYIYDIGNLGLRRSQRGAGQLLLPLLKICVKNTCFCYSRKFSFSKSDFFRVPEIDDRLFEMLSTTHKISFP